jgi:hypothetical protein
MSIRIKMSDTQTNEWVELELSDPAAELVAEAIRQGLRELSPYAHGPVMANAMSVAEGINRLV